MTVEVIIPWRAGCPHRERAFKWVLKRWAQHPWPVTVAEAPDGPWCKAEVLRPAIEASTADIVFVVDADVWCDGIPQAVAAVEAGAPWVIPHLVVRRLTEAATGRLLAGGEPEPNEITEPPYIGVMSGGLVVVRRDVALDVPMSASFVGWGGEDHAWGWALATLIGDPWRGEEPLWHLWHPPAERISRLAGSEASEQLRRRYFSAQNDRPAMRALVEAGRTWPSPESTSTPTSSPTS